MSEIDPSQDLFSSPPCCDENQTLIENIDSDSNITQPPSRFGDIQIIQSPNRNSDPDETQPPGGNTDIEY